MVLLARSGAAQVVVLMRPYLPDKRYPDVELGGHPVQDLVWRGVSPADACRLESTIAMSRSG